ncbi:MAG: DinB family protein [Acidobacteriota bacterium]
MEFSIPKTLEVLSATTLAVEALLGGLSGEWVGPGTPEAWGAFEIVGHLIHCEQADWMVRARIILDHGDARTFEPLDRLAQFEHSTDEPLAALLSQFTRLRNENLEMLRSWNLTDEKLDLIGMHPELGVVTLRQLLAAWAVHDLTHIRQLATVVAKNYASAVGPFREYLSILN